MLKMLIATGKSRTDRTARQVLPSAVIFAALFFPVPSVSAAPPSAELAPHSAVYAVKLLSAKPKSRIQSVSGEIGVKWEADCGGWTMTHRMALAVGYTGGEAIRLDMTAATWESPAGDHYTFSVRTAFDGREADIVEGHARRTASGSTAVFTQPEARKMALPSDVLFPTAHTNRILAAAQAGVPFLSATVFDGFGAKGAQQVSAVIGRPHIIPEADARRFPALAGQMMSKVQLAFYGDAERQALPESEIGIGISGTGIARTLEMDFGDFKINADLTRLEVGEKPVCGN